MLLISHRGNVNGPQKNENSPELITQTLELGYDCEIDVYFDSVNNVLALGHDFPQYPIDISFLKNHKLWVHAKNLESLNLMLQHPQIHCFWHQKDDVTLTSHSYVWTFPGCPIIDRRAIAVCPERVNGWDISKAYGVCSDFIGQYE